MSRVKEYEKQTAKMLNDEGLMVWDMIAVELIELNRTMALIYDHLSNQEIFGDLIRNKAEEKRREDAKRREGAAADGEGNERNSETN